MRLAKNIRWPVVAVAVATISLVLPTAAVGTGPDDGLSDGHRDLDLLLPVQDSSDDLAELDAAASQVISDGPSAKVTKNLQLRGRGDRLVANATTDVWAHKRFAYTGTFNSPCGGEDGAGVWIWNVRNKNKPSFVGVIESEPGSRSNDVKVDTMNSGDILVHTNETCGEGGLGGFEVYNVDDPRNPMHLATVRVREPNDILAQLEGGMNRGVHNLFLFTQGSRDYVALATHGNAIFGSTQIFEITDPTNPQFVSAWGPELICEGDFCSEDPYNETDIPTLVNTVNFWVAGLATGPTPGFGGSLIRSVHDITVTEDGTFMYTAAWDGGLVLLDISDPATPEVVSVALEPEAGSPGDGEVNSHSVWPSEDGTIVVEGEEDFNAWVTVQPLSNFTFGEQPWNTVPGVGVSTSAGDDFEANQTGNMVTVTATSVTVNSGPLAGNVYPAEEGAGNQPKIADTGPLEAEAVWVGRGCDTDNFGTPNDVPGIVDPHLNDPEGKIAVIRRGACTFSSKLGAAQAAGAIGVVIANNLRNDTPWSGIRVWDYSDPENPVLASTFDTVCSASPTPIPECDTLGTYSVHNVVVETTGRHVKAYLSWYWDGMLVLDVTDPYNPQEVARYFDNSPEFLESNGGQPHDFWGVWKVPNKPWIYGSDRNGGLKIFKEVGAGNR